MSRADFVKRYDDAGRCAAARAHHFWLGALGSKVRLPRLLHADDHVLVFEFLPGRAGRAEDLPRLAATVGRLDAAAHRHTLHAADLRKPYPATVGLSIRDFASPRREALEREAPAAGLNPASLSAILDTLPDRPAAIYKDANPRNFLVTGDDVAVVDFDDLTLAPFGYDLAKIVVTTSMTDGALGARAVQRALDTYNARIQPLECQAEDLALFAELHHLLTARYIGRHGYRHPWPTVRPWPEPRSFLAARTVPAMEPSR